MEMNGTILIKQPAEVIFDYVKDPGNDSNWRTGVTRSVLEGDQKLGAGSKGYTLAGKDRADWEVVSYVKNQKVNWVFTDGPFLGTGGYLLSLTDEGTQFTLVADVTPSGFLKLLGPLFGWIGRRQNQRDVEKLRSTLESV